MRYTLILLLALVSSLTAEPADAEVLKFDKSPYGLLFADIVVNGVPVTAMIDFGDPYVLQLASSFLDEHGIAVEPTGQYAFYADGTQFEMKEGTVEVVEIGGQRLLDQTFGSAAGEIDAVAEQVGTPFRAAVGWGFFGSRTFLLDYSDRAFRMDLEVCPAGETGRVKREPGDRYLIIEGRVANRDARFLIDTGSPVNAVHTDLANEVTEHGTPASIPHAAGMVPGTTMMLSLGELQLEATFEHSDLSALEPLGAQAILGAPFLSMVRLCHEPGRAELQLYLHDRIAGVKPGRGRARTGST